MLSIGDRIYYFEYMDHAKTFGDPSKIMNDPCILWCSGKIFQESDDFLAILCSGTKNKLPSSEPSYEIIYKKAIIKQEEIYIVK